MMQHISRHCDDGFSVGALRHCERSEAIQEKRSRTNLWFSAMTCGWWNASKYVIVHLLRDQWIASSQAPRNDVR